MAISAASDSFARQAAVSFVAPWLLQGFLCLSSACSRWPVTRIKFSSAAGSAADHLLVTLPSPLPFHHAVSSAVWVVCLQNVAVAWLVLK